LVEINTTTTRPLPRWHLDGTAGSAEAPYSLDYHVERWAELRFTSAVEGERTRRLDVVAGGLSEVEIWERFGAALRGEGTPAVDVRTVLCTMALLDAARQSAREGRAVDVRDVVEWVY
jgi:predicted dehydrogenase